MGRTKTAGHNGPMRADKTAQDRMRDVAERPRVKEAAERRRAMRDRRPNGLGAYTRCAP